MGSANVFGGGGLLSFYTASGQRVQEVDVDSPVAALAYFASGTQSNVFSLCQPALQLASHSMLSHLPR